MPYNEQGDADSWYGQNAAGFQKMEVGKDFLLTPQINNNPSNPRGQTVLAERVLYTIGEWRGDGWEGWIAAQGQGDNPGARDMWVWPLDNRNKYLEYIWCDGGMHATELHEQLALHRGRGWQFPLIVFFPDEPGELYRTVLKDWKVPYAVQPTPIEWPTVEEVPEPSPTPDVDWDKAWQGALNTLHYKQRLEKKINIIFEILMEGGE